MPKIGRLEKYHLQEIVELYKSGVSAVSIARQFTAATTTVTNLLKKFGVQIRPKTESISMAWDERKADTVRFEEYVRTLSNRLKNRKFSQETMDKMSRSRAEGIANGTIEHRTYGKQGYNSGLFCRSKYESDFIDYCNKYDIKVETCKFVIPYEYEGKKHNYVPDFYLPELKKVVEVKPIKLKSSAIVQAKAKAAEKFLSLQNISYTFVTELTLYKKPIYREDYNL